MKPARRWHFATPVLLVFSCLLLCCSEAATEPPSAREILEVTGVRGGLVVHLGCGNGRLTTALRANDRFLVHGLDVNPANVEQGRRLAESLRLSEWVSFERWNGGDLPYVDNLVNLLVAEEPSQVPAEEMLRVLAPGGVAYVKHGNAWIKTQKPWPSDIDQWTHFLHGPDNNAVARDRRIDIPRSMQWVAEPRWGRSHEELASLSAAVTAAGRIYYIVDEAPLASIRFLGDWKLVARDAFNGTLLWKRPIGPWNDHLRHFRSGPAHLPRRLVAVGDTVYVTPGLDAPVVAIDGATGQTIREYPGTAYTEEIVVDGGVLYLAAGTSEVNRRGGGLFDRGEPRPSDFRYVTAIQAESGKPIWKHSFPAGESLLPLTLAVKGPHVYYQTTQGVVCRAASSGQQAWLAPRQTPAQRMAFSAPTLVATDEVVLSADRDPGKSERDEPAAGTVEWGVHGWNEPGFARSGKCTLRAYAADDGRELWSADCQEGYNSPVDVFVIQDRVWVGTRFAALDLKTGETVKQINTSGPRVGMPHHRCYRDKASERFIFTGKSGIEVLDLDRGWLSNNSWIRGTCQYGILPANGLLYAPPDACACFLTVKSPGFFAAAPQRSASGEMPFPQEPVIEKGPLYGKPLHAVEEIDAWPTYRHDAARSGTTAGKLPAEPSLRWSTPVGGRLTQPSVAGGRVFVASVDSHTLHALDAADGHPLWQFTAGGRIDSSPTVYQGSVIFGSADGWVYCLGAADGSLVWRFRAAPADRRACAYGQLESLWPVHGAVLVQNGSVYLTAGRSSYLDGGLVLYRLDPATGKQLAKSVLCHLDPQTGEQLVPEAAFNMEGTTSDVLSGDGELVFLKYFCFDRNAQRTETSRPHLFSIAGLLGEEWFVRSYWVLGEGMPGAGWSNWANAANRFPFGRILCFTPDTVYGYGRQQVSGGPTGHRADAYHLYARGRRPTEASPPAKARARRAPAEKSDLQWSDPHSLMVRAMVLGSNCLAVAGPEDLGQKERDILAFANEPVALAGFEGQKGVYLRIVDTTDGQSHSQCQLPAMPVFDGMAAAGGKLYVSLRDGSLACMSDR